MINKKALFSFILVSSIVVAGCSNKNNLSGLVPASGELVFKDQPLAGAAVTFSPVGGAGAQSRAASAETDAEGRFVMSTLRSGDGVYPGEYAVMVGKFEEPPASVGQESESGNPEYTAKSLIPEKYMAAKTSGITVTIPAEGNKQIKIELNER